MLHKLIGGPHSNLGRNEILQLTKCPMKWRDAVQRSNPNHSSGQKSLDRWTLVVLHRGFLGALVVIDLKIFLITISTTASGVISIVFDSRFYLQPFFAVAIIQVLIKR